MGLPDRCRVHRLDEAGLRSAVPPLFVDSHAPYTPALLSRIARQDPARGGWLVFTEQDIGHCSGVCLNGGTRTLELVVDFDA